jgi:hypothetical protein
MIAAHPFRGQRLIFDSQPPIEGGVDIETGCAFSLLEYVDAIEVFNGWAYRREWKFTMEVGKRLGLNGTGGSDAHKLLQTGVCYTVFDRWIRNEEELLVELKAGRFIPVNCDYGISPVPPPVWPGSHES